MDVFRGAKIVETYDKSGQLVGLFIGTLIDTDRQLVIDDRVVFDADISEVRDIDRFVELQIYRFAGRFLFILEYAWPAAHLSRCKRNQITCVQSSRASCSGDDVPFALFRGLSRKISSRTSTVRAA